ncbi:response regulator transcription factor [Myroides indicus]|uniref:DNA-binding response OmpR family regulator n=1 Tax=Myroides indicus TaxID=1323422 RepID=A0A4R7EN43_9FLAO|nr:response regulator transcription factor [Myroides indicus]TDS52435.1 DNA-binding response OmpR family regulator [Myroides indicus]
MSTAKVLMVEDEMGIAHFIKQGLQEEGFSVIHCLSGKEALNIIDKQLFDIILLDWMMLNISGLEICKTIRQSANKNRSTPIIFLTAKDTVQDTIEGLNAGANDYIKKPFAFDELIARIQVYLRNNSKPNRIALGNIEIDSSTHQAFLNGKLVDLTLKEFQLLFYLFNNKNQVCSRREIIKNIWDIHFEYDTSVIDVFVNAIRKKLNLKKDDPRLHTVRGLGYISKDV